MNPQTTQSSAPSRARALGLRAARGAASGAQARDESSIVGIPTSQWYRSGELFGTKPGVALTRAPKERAANYDACTSASTYFVHGITWGQPEHQSVSDRYGCPTTMIVNDQDRSIVLDAKNTVAGMMNSDWGRDSEPEAVAKTMRVLRKALRDKRPIRLLAFSQGGVIASNALFELQEELTEDQWEQLAEQVHIHAFGSAMHEWPEAVHVVEYAHSGDSVATYSSWFSSGKEQLLSAFEQDSDKEDPKRNDADKVVEIPYRGDDAHSAEAYMRHLPDFFIASHKGDDGKIDEKKLAESLARSIETAGFADSVHQEILNQVASSAKFRDAFRAETKENGSGRFEIKNKRVAALFASRK